ncbi:MAG: arsenate reductase ArsC, partial [Methanoregula sp.]|nr:arsenate reductase ArsC [Methanoregula sp.]
MDDKLTPCAADALQQVRQIRVDGKPVGIVRLDETINEVLALNLSQETEICAALMQRITRHNYIPDSAGDAYAKSLLAEFYAGRMKQRMAQALKNYSRIDLEKIHPGGYDTLAKKRVLFICTANAARSQMAEGLLRARYSNRYEVYSAGTRQSKVSTRAITVMQEIGIDLSHHRSKTIDDVSGISFDLAVTLCDNAHAV